MNCKSLLLTLILACSWIIIFTGCADKKRAELNIPESWEYVEMANGKIILYEPIKKKGGQMLYSPYNPDYPDGNHRELKGYEVRWQPLLTKKEIESKRQMQKIYRSK